MILSDAVVFHFHFVGVRFPRNKTNCFPFFSSFALPFYRCCGYEEVIIRVGFTNVYSVPMGSNNEYGKIRAFHNCCLAAFYVSLAGRWPRDFVSPSAGKRILPVEGNRKYPNLKPTCAMCDFVSLKTMLYQTANSFDSNALEDDSFM